MGNSTVVQKFEGIGNVAGDQRRLLFSEANFSLDVVQQRATAHFLENHIEATLILKPFNQLD